MATDDVFFATEISMHSGENAIAPNACTALLGTGSPQTFIRRDVLDRKLTVGAASLACEWPSSPRSWGGFGESAFRVFTDRNSHPSERLILPLKRTDVISRNAGMRDPSTGHAARCLARLRQLDALQHPCVPPPAPSSPR